MTVFLFVVGLEIKRELVAGELRGWRRAALPATAALGGMAIPPLIYVALNAGSDNLSRWDIPMATDIAFAVGCSRWSPDKPLSSLKTLLLGIAIVDDIGAIVCHCALLHGTNSSRVVVDGRGPYRSGGRDETAADVVDARLRGRGHRALGLRRSNPEFTQRLRGSLSGS
jgi:hypothetical protein